MQTFENLILENCSTEFNDIAHTWFLGMCLQLKFVQMVVPPRLVFTGRPK